MAKLFQFNADDVNVEKRETVFQGFFRMDKLWLTHPRFDGRDMPVFTRELFIRGDATCVLPYDPERDEVVLLEQFRTKTARALKKSLNARARKRPDLPLSRWKKSAITWCHPAAARK